LAIGDEAGWDEDIVEQPLELHRVPRAARDL